MSVLTVAGTQLPAGMIDYQTTVPPPTTIPYRSQYSSSQPAGYSPLRASGPDVYTMNHSPNINPSHFTSSHHHHSRSASSSILPGSPLPNASQTHSRQSSAGLYSSPSSTSTNMNMHRQPTSASDTSIPRRSTSSRSSNSSPTSYVALMRKQKATVWCDRSQNIDHRMAAAQRAAKQRATQEVQSGSGPGRTSTINSAGISGKISRHGVSKSSGYEPANLTGVVLAPRLSEYETLKDEEETVGGDNPMAQARTGSGRSSTNSARYRSGYPRPDPGRFSAGNTPPAGTEGGSSPHNGVSESAIRPTNNMNSNHAEYFDHHDNPGLVEHEDSFGEVQDMKAPSSAVRAAEQVQTAEELRRRGSVDERAMSMGAGVRLYIANP